MVIQQGKQVSMDSKEKLLNELRLVQLKSQSKMMRNIRSILTDYKKAELIKLVLDEKKDLYWIFITSSAVNVLFLTP